MLRVFSKNKPVDRKVVWREVGASHFSDSTRDGHGRNAPIRALQLGAGWFPEASGGLERYYYELTRALPAAGVQCVGLVAGSDRVESTSSYRIRSFGPAAGSLMSRWKGVRHYTRKIIEAEELDIAVAHFALYAFPVLGLIRRLPLVVHFHGPWAQEARVEGNSTLASTIRGIMERQLYARGTRLVVLSSAFKKVLCSQYRVNEDLVKVIPGGVDSKRFDILATRREARARLEWPQDRPIVLTVRRLTNRMGLSDLVRCVSVLRKTIPDVLVLIAGTGPLAEALLAQIKEAGLQNSVRLLGYLPEESLPLAYRAADLTVVPTVALEGFGLIAAESLGAGTPVLVTPIGGLPEVVKDLAENLVLSGTGPEALADGVKQALTGKLGLPSAERCQKHVASKFDWSVVAGMISNVYSDACGASRRMASTTLPPNGHTHMPVFAAPTPAPLGDLEDDSWDLAKTSPDSGDECSDGAAAATI